MAMENPYAPPASNLLRAPSPPRFEELATTGQRFSNLVLDYVGSTLAGALVGVLTVLAGAEESLAYLDNWIVGSLVVFAYYAGFEGVFSRTPAKWVTGTMVVDEAGGRPTFARICGRTLTRLVPFEPLSFLGGEGHPVGWHDAWSKTRVVRTRARAADPV